MRLLVTGAAGQLGTDLVAACRGAGDEVIAVDRAGLDVCDRSAVLAAVTTLRPDAVANCAAWTAVDACEADPARAFAANGAAVRWLAEACARSGAFLVQVSTDYVFDGSGDAARDEEAPTGPLSVYGRTKLEGEQFIRVAPADNVETLDNGFFDVQGANDTNRADLFVFGSDERMVVTARLDNLGKGAAGAA